MIRSFLHFVVVLALGVWVGTVTYFTFVLTPGIFAVLDASTRRPLLSRIFPDFYMIQMMCGLAALLTLALLVLIDSGQRMRRLFQVGLVVVMLAIILYSGTILEGEIHALRDDRVREVTQVIKAELEKRFSRLHGRSMILNLATLGLGVIALGSAAPRRRSRD